MVILNTNDWEDTMGFYNKKKNLRKGMRKADRKREDGWIWILQDFLWIWQ